MLKHEDNAVTPVGGVLRQLAGISVTVTDKVTGLPASLYKDDEITPIPQPLTTDNTGYYGFKAPDGTYLLTFSGQRIATFTREIVLDDPKDNPYVTVAGIAAGQGAAGIGYGGRTVADKLGDAINAFDKLSEVQRDAVKARTYDIDLSAPLQAALDEATAAGKPLDLPPGGFKANLILRAGSVLRGANWFAADWRVSAMAKTNIRGSITVDQTDINQGYIWGLHVSNLNIEGSGVAGSRGLYIKNVEGSTFENIGISKFARGLEVENGMFNSFTGINSSGCSEAAFYLNGAAITTTQEFNECIARESPWGWIGESTANGNSIGTRLNGCKVESTTMGGINFHKSCSVEINGLYAENAPDGRAITNGTLIRLHKDGVDVSPYDSTAIINGGNLAGDNFNLQTDATAIDIGTSRFVAINSPVIRRAKNGIRCATDTPANSVYLSGPQFVQVTNDYVNTDGKICGVYPSAGLSASPRSRARLGELTVTNGSNLAGQTILAANETRALAAQGVTIRIDDTASPNVEFLNSAGARMALLTNAGNLFLTGSIGANGGSATQPTVTGSRGGNAALASLLSQLEAKGFITNGTTA